MASKSYLPFPLFLVILGVVGIGAWYTIKTYAPRSQPLSINEVASTGSVDLALTPNTIELTPNTSTTISLSANSGTDKLSLVQLELIYDPDQLTITDLTLGNWITQSLKPLSLADGKITGEIGAKPDFSTTDGGPELSRTGSGIIFTFKVKGSSPGTYPITFNSGATNAWTAGGISMVDGIPNVVNMLRSVSGTTITISNPRLIADIIGSTHKVDKYDYVELINQYGQSPAGTADFNSSGAVEGADYTLLMADYGKTW